MFNYSVAANVGPAQTITVSFTQPSPATFTIYQAGSAAPMNETMTVSEVGQGTVTSMDGSINCISGGGACSANYPSGTVVTLNATAATGWSFQGWSGACSGSGSGCQVTMNSNLSSTATFTQVQTANETLTLSEVGQGTVTSMDGSINCISGGGACSANYPSGTVVTLNATAATGWSFQGWSGACSGSGSGCQVTMNSNLSSTATFTQQTAPVITSLMPSTIPAASGSFPLIVSGTGFVPGAVVYFEEVPLATAFISGTQLLAQVPPGQEAGTSISLSVRQLSVASPPASSSVVASELVVNSNMVDMEAVTTPQTNNMSVQVTDFGGVEGFGVAATTADMPCTNVPSSSSSCNWLSTTASNGLTTPSQLSITVNPAGLAVGLHSGGITISPNDGSGGQYVGVTLSTTPVGTIQVNATLNGSPWNGMVNYQVTGPSIWNEPMVPASSQTAIAGTYMLTGVSGGPSGATLTNITYSPNQTLSGGGTTTATLNFSAATSNYTLTVSEVGPGLVTSTDGSINCISGSGACSAIFTSGTIVTLNATAAGGWSFQSWGGACSGSGSVCQVTMNSNLSPNATFKQNVINPTQGPLLFVTMPPCRVVDTRDNTKPEGFGPPSFSVGTTRSFTIPSGPCNGIPANAQAYALNVTVVPNGPLEYITVWPTGQSQPNASTLNSFDGEVKANAAIVAAGTGAAISVYATNDTDVVLDINGYFVPNTEANALAFYPLAPCRVVDTRPGAASTIATGRLAASSITTLPILSSNCNVPATAQAYSLNFTLVPPETPVAYLTVWPTGEAQPFVSTLNDPTGTVEANAGIVPAGFGGSIDVYVTDATDLVVDINGYFAPAAEGGLSLYTLAPCRVLDTRNPVGTPPFQGAINVDVIRSGCIATNAAQAYVFNATVVPGGPLAFLTLWPAGSGQPLVSTLNAYTGQVTSNMAIVPTKNTEISAYTSNNTYLILDLFGYFAP